MAVAPRPGAGRRSDADEASISVLFEGERYTIHPNRLSVKDTTAVRKAVGSSLVNMMAEPDLDLVVTVVWLARRRMDPSLSFDQVAEGVTYDTKFEVSVNTEAVDDDEDDSPEQ